MRDIKQIINKINNDIKIMKESGCNMKRVFIKLDEKEFKKNVFEINKIPVIYGEVTNKEAYKLMSLR